jgi:phosphoenolpyruvate-protein kinase (PTS system EI component)
MTCDSPTRWSRLLLRWLVRQVQRGFALREEGKSGMVASLSHGAIVAREYGLPAVVNIPGIPSHTHDGETLTVDGDATTVRRIP